MMKRPLIAVSILLLGAVGVPFVSLPSDPFGWQLFAGVYDADLAVEKTDNAPAVLRWGDQFDYTLTVTNHGPVAATGVVVDDALPGGVDYLSDTCGGTYTAGTHTWSWLIGNLAVAAQVSCDIRVRVESGAVGELENVVVVTGTEPDPTPANNTSSATVTVEPTRIPTLSRTGILIAILSLASLAWIILRRRGPPL